MSSFSTRTRLKMSTLHDTYKYHAILLESFLRQEVAMLFVQLQEALSVIYQLNRILDCNKEKTQN